MHRIFCENQFQVKQAVQKSCFRSFRLIWESQSSWGWKGSVEGTWCSPTPWQGRDTWGRGHRTCPGGFGMWPEGCALLGSCSSWKEVLPHVEVDEVKLSLCRAVGQSHFWGCSSIRSSPKLWLSTAGSAPRIRSSSKVITMDCLLF